MTNAQPLFHIAFYRFVRVADPEQATLTLRELTRELLGSILVAQEGINGTVAGPAAALAAFEAALAHDPRLGGLFAGMAFKRTACRSAPFHKMKVHHRPEVLPLGVDGIDAVGHAGTQVSPADWRALIRQPDVVLIDNRNHFEVRLGRFEGAIDPLVNNFRDFPRYIEAHAPQWKAKGQRVAMYCTGGIRCEKTAAWMHGMGLEVLQLEGGILNYLAQMREPEPEPEPDADAPAETKPAWQGECFVFDNRIALDAKLQETGTRAEQVYADSPDEAWRLRRARQLALSDAAEAQARPPATRHPAAPLPLRDGVSASCVVLPAGPWQTVAEFLTQRFAAQPPAVWAARIAAGDVIDEHGNPITLQSRHQPQLRVFYYRELPAEPRIPFDETVLFQDEHLLVVDKPHFLPVTPGGRYLQETLLVRLKRRLGLEALQPLHRLDRETAGVMLFGLQRASRGAYQRLFAERAMEKHYECIAPWRPDLAWPLQRCSHLVVDEHFMRMREAPGEPDSDTRFEVIEVQGAWARYRLTPLTGRKHQLRVHCAALGMAIAGDRIYPQLLAEGSDDFTRPLQLLAKNIAFRDPLSGAARYFESPRSLSLAHFADPGRADPAAIP